MALITKDQRFGRWLTLEDQQYTFVRRISAKCDCGTRRKVRIANLTTGRSNSCGCFNREILAKAGHARLRFPVNPGDVYTRLTVIDSSDRMKVQCLCTCGNTTTVTANALYGGNTRSCGCFKREVAQQMGRNRATRGGVSKNSLFGTWARMRKREGPSHQPWVDDAALFVHEVEAAIGPRPKGMYLRLKSEAEGYVPGNVQWGERPRNKNQHVALNDQQRSEVIELVDSGETQTSVAKAYGVSRSLIGDIYKKHRAAQ